MTKGTKRLMVITCLLVTSLALAGGNEPDVYRAIPPSSSIFVHIERTRGMSNLPLDTSGIDKLRAIDLKNQIVSEPERREYTPAPTVIEQTVINNITNVEEKETNSYYYNNRRGSYRYWNTRMYYKARHDAGVIYDQDIDYLGDEDEYDFDVRHD